MPANLENSAVTGGLEKVNFHPNAKESSNYCTIALISHASKRMFKILQARLQQYVKWELPDVQAGFIKDREKRDQIANICWIIEKARESKTSTSVSLSKLKPLTVWVITNCGKLLKRWEYQTILPVSWETCMWVKKQQLEPCMEQVTGWGLRKEYKRAVCYHPVYFNLYAEQIMSSAQLDEL